MYTILKKQYLTPAVTEMVVSAPRVAASALPGQFLIVRVGENGERIPLTICDYDREAGTVTIVTQAIGISSTKINALQEGDSFADVAGPLGRPSDLLELSDEQLRQTHVLFVAGGVGTAPVYPQAKWLHSRGCRADVIIGAKTASLLTYVEKMRQVADVHICTDDGSEGFAGMVPALMRKLLDDPARHYDRCVVIGPMIMMKFAALTTQEYNLPTVASLNALMVDGTGMCGACRVSVGGETRFTCVDGPEFDAHLIDFDQAMRRQNMYRDNIKTNPEKNKCNCHG